jgi:hypothetical protein
MQAISLPPTWGIADAQVREFCDAVRHALTVRESGGDEGYITKREFARLSADSVVSLLSGAASGGSVPTTTTYQTAIDAVRAIVMSDPIFDYLRAPLDASGESGVGGAAITEEFRAFVSKVDGSMNTTWSVKTNVNGRVTGVALMTSAGAGSAPGTSSSHFAIMADRLSLINPSNDGIDAVPFSVDGSGNAIFTGTIYAAAGSFGGALSAATGTFNGELTVGSSPAISGTTMTGSGAHLYSDGRFALGKATQNVVYNGTDLYLNGFKASVEADTGVVSIYSGAAISSYANAGPHFTVLDFVAETPTVLIVAKAYVGLDFSAANNTMRTFEVMPTVEVYNVTTATVAFSLPLNGQSRWHEDTALGAIGRVFGIAYITADFPLTVGHTYRIRFGQLILSGVIQSSGAADVNITDITASVACQVQQLRL